MMSFDPTRLQGKHITDAIRANIFDRNDYRQRKRTSALSPTTIQNALERGNSTAILLYAFQQRLEEISNINICNRAFLVRLCEIAGDRRKIVDMLTYYKAIVSRLSPVMRRMRTLRRLQVLVGVPDRVNNEVGHHEVFSDLVLYNLLDRLKVKRPPSH